MPVKYAGAAVLILACTAAGVMKSLALVRRVRELEAFIGAVGDIATEIRYFASPTDVILSKLNAHSAYAGLKVFGICEKLFSETRSFKTAWEKAVDLSQPFLALDREDIEILKRFGESFGTTDVTGEMANCDHCLGGLRRRLEAARTEKTKRGRMYTSLGLLIGILISMVLI